MNSPAFKSARRLFAESPIAGPLATLIVVVAVCSIFVPNFFSWRSFAGIVNAATLTGVVTIGITLLMIAGEFDLSVGSLIAIGGYLYAFNTIGGGSPLLAIGLALLVPALLGALNGLLLTRIGIPSFIATLGTRSIYRGAVWLITGGILLQTLEGPAIYSVFNGRLDTLADLFKGANFRTSTLWLIGMVILFQYLLTRTRFGNHVFAAGGNVGAAAAQGVNVKRVKVMNFVVSGLLAGLTGILLFSQYKSVRVTTGAGEELKAIAAAVVGGALLSGGAGSIWGALIGVLLISALRTAVVLLDFPADNFDAIVGVTIVGAVILNRYVHSRA